MNEQPTILTGGFSGDILVHLPHSVLRIYRGTPDIKHIVLLKNLGSIGMAPQIYHDFGTGHIEEYLNGTPLSMADSKEMFFHVAHALDRLHTVPIALVQSVNIWDPWTEMSKCIDIGDFRNNINDGVHIIAGVSADKISVEIESLHELLRPFLDSEPMCLSHNDLFRGNIMRCGNDVRLIDWEMTAMFHPLYDAANFFCECCIDINLNYDPSAFPSLKRQMEFMCICLGRKPSIRDMHILHLFILLSHLYWTVSGVSYTPEYSSTRFVQYLDGKEALTKLYK